MVGREGDAAATSGEPDLEAQSARALRNLSVNPQNKAQILELGGLDALHQLAESSSERVQQQAQRALLNLGYTTHK